MDISALNLLNDFFESSSIARIIANSDSLKVVRANQEAIRLFDLAGGGYGTSLTDLIPDLNIALLQEEHLNTVINCIMIKRNGSYFRLLKSRVLSAAGLEGSAQRYLMISVLNEQLFSSISGLPGNMDDNSAPDKVIFELEHSLREKEVLLKEIHHRVKNNLQVIYSLLNLQMGYIDNDDVQKILSESQSRIMTMAFIHECLYKSRSFSHIPMYEYVKELSDFLNRTYYTPEKEINIELNIDENLCLELRQATSCGIIINELLSNSLKHAFKKARHGNIRISIVSTDGFCNMTLEDDGEGFDYKKTGQESKTFGLELISIMIRQLVGEMDTDAVEGTKVSIVFPVNS